MMSATCPCGSSAAYAACCGRLHMGAPASSAEALMRSRYTAFVLALPDYLLLSWHPRTRPTTLVCEATLKWLGLSIKRHQITGLNHATVEFVARSRQGGGAAQRLHETSRFEREGDHWFYVDGDVH